MIDCLRSFSLAKLRGPAHLVALGPVSMMLCYVTVKPATSVGHIGMLRTKLLWRDLPRTYLAHHEPARVTIMIIIIIIIIIIIVVINMLHKAGTVMVKRTFEQQQVEGAAHIGGQYLVCTRQWCSSSRVWYSRSLVSLSTTLKGSVTGMGFQKSA